MRILGFARFGSAILGLVGVVALGVHGNSNNPDFRWLNFFSYFTIEANVIGALVLLIAGFAALRGSQTPGTVRSARRRRGLPRHHRHRLQPVAARPGEPDDRSPVGELHRPRHHADRDPSRLPARPHRAPARPAERLVVVGIPAGVDGVHVDQGTDRRLVPVSVPDAGAKGWGHVLLYVLGIAVAFLAVGTVLAYSTRVLNRSQPKPVAAGAGGPVLGGPTGALPAQLPASRSASDNGSRPLSRRTSSVTRSSSPAATAV